MIHPSTVEEIRRYKNREREEALNIKLEAYEVLRGASEPPVEFSSQLPEPKDENDRIDNSLLYELYMGYVDLLITEDKRLRGRANLLGLQEKVYSIEIFIGLQSKLHPNLVEYKMLAVEQCTFRELNLDDPFFDSLKQDYPGFE